MRPSAGFEKPVAYCRKCSMFWTIARRTYALISILSATGPIPKSASLRLLTKYTRDFAFGTTSHRRSLHTHSQQFGYYLERSLGATAALLKTPRHLLKYPAEIRIIASVSAFAACAQMSDEVH